MDEAVRRFVHDGDVIVIEGFTHLICFAAAHEIIRQGRRDLTLCRLTPDLIYEQLIGAGCARRLIFSWAGNPGAGPLYALRRAVEQAGYHVQAIEGLLLKPITTAQIKTLHLPDSVLNAMLKVGVQYPELSAGLLIQAGLAPA